MRLIISQGEVIELEPKYSNSFTIGSTYRPLLRAAPETSATIDCLACLSPFCARRIPCPIQNPIQRGMGSLHFDLKE